MVVFKLFLQQKLTQGGIWTTLGDILGQKVDPRRHFGRPWRHFGTKNRYKEAFGSALGGIWAPKVNPRKHLDHFGSHFDTKSRPKSAHDFRRAQKGVRVMYVPSFGNHFGVMRVSLWTKNQSKICELRMRFWIRFLQSRVDVWCHFDLILDTCLVKKSKKKLVEFRSRFWMRCWLPRGTLQGRKP